MFNSVKSVSGFPVSIPSACSSRSGVGVGLGATVAWGIVVGTCVVVWVGVVVLAFMKRR